MVVLAASICTRGGKAVLSRQFREIARSRVEALLAAFPKLADSGTQHTTVEQDNVRYVYQPLDELYMVLITNRQSNILQDIDSLHLFAQVVSSICRSLDEREILRNAFELLSAFDELVTLGYRENLSIAQIKTFLEMESHEERIQEIISRNKELEATEERKRKAKFIEMQRKEAQRTGRAGTPRAPSYPAYTPPVQPAAPSTYESYEAERNKSFAKSAPKGKGMQLGKKNKTTDMFAKVRDDLGVSAAEEAAPLVQTPAASAPVQAAAASRPSASGDGINVTIAEQIAATLSREGALKSFSVKGELKLQIHDPSLTKVRLALTGSAPTSQLKTHPRVDKTAFSSGKEVKLANATQGFPVNSSVGVVKWTVPKPANAEAAEVLPITFTVWVNKNDSSISITVEYELGTGGPNGQDSLSDVSVSIPYASAEPTVQSFDAMYEVTGDSIDWNIGPVDEDNSTGSFEFEAAVDDENEFFPMRVQFSKSKPYVDIDVSDVTLIEEGEDMTFVKEVRSVAENYIID